MKTHSSNVSCIIEKVRVCDSLAPVEGHNMTFIKIKSKINTMDPMTEDIELRLLNKAVRRRVDLKVDFNIIYEKKKFHT